MSSLGEPIECLKCGSENIECLEIEKGHCRESIETVDECRDCRARWSNIWNFAESIIWNFEEEDGGAVGWWDGN